jgi:CRP-like cAMP-binding protein
VTDERLAALRSAPLFAEVGDGPLARLAEAAEPIHLAAGEPLIREGDPAEELYIVVSGEFEIRKRSGNAEVALTRVGPGSVQGEIAAFERGRRMASVYAVGDAEALRLPFESVRAMLGTDPEVATALLR